MNLIIAAVLTVCLLTPAISANAAGQAEEQQGLALNATNIAAFLNQFFQSETVKQHYVGASVVVVKDSEVIAQKGFGYTDLAMEEEVDPASTVFRVGSISKTLNAVAAMQLVERGKLRLQDDIRMHLDGLNADNPFGKPVTIADLLAHTTGFEARDLEANGMTVEIDSETEMEAYVRSHIPPVVREPGSSYLYDNFASLLLGVIVQRASGMPYDDYMSKHLFEPLGMNSSAFRSDSLLLERLPVGFDAQRQPVELSTVQMPVLPHGSMLSTAEDMGSFMIALLNGGALDNVRILKKDTVLSMFSYRSLIHSLLPDTTYGFEAPFQLPGAGSSSKIVTKSGDVVGNSSYMFLIPEQNTGVFLTYTQNGALRQLFYSQFIETFFPQYAAPVELAAYKSSSREELGKFSGYYSDLRLNGMISQVDITDQANLQISDAYLGSRALIQVDDNLFIDQLTHQFTAFKLNSSGQVVYMKEPYLNPSGYARKGVEATGFADIDNDNPYSPAILMLQSVGFYDNVTPAHFEPELGVSRAAFVMHLLEISGLKKGSSTKELAFTDLEGHSTAAFIQLAYELGFVYGNGEGSFAPDRIITRQEAAVVVWRVLSGRYPGEWFDEVPLAGETSAWARQAVQMMVVLGLFGPEVKLDEAGSTDFLSLKQLTRQEEAAMLYALLLTPADQIVMAMRQQQTVENP